MNGILDDTIAYLVGPIDRCTDKGQGWRNNIKIMAKDKGMKIRFLDPTNKLAGLVKDVGDEQERIHYLKKEQKWEELSQLIKNIVHSDLRCVDFSDFIIMHIDPNIHMAGSYHEMIVAITQKKPIFVFVEGGKINTPSWIFGILDHNNIFDNIVDVVEHLHKINIGEICLDNRWVIIRKEINGL